LSFKKKKERLQLKQRELQHCKNIRS